MRKFGNFLFWICIVAFLSACTVYQKVPIEVLRLSEVTLPRNSSTRIAFMYRNFKADCDTFQNYFGSGYAPKKDPENEGKNIDSIVVSSCINSVAKTFLEKGVTNYPVIFPADMMPRVIGDTLKLLSPEIVKEIAHYSHTDFIISLETFTFFFYHFRELFKSYDSQKVKMAGVWGVYRGDNGGNIDLKVMVDTLYWNREEMPDSAGKISLPPRLTALQLAAEVFGESYAARFYDDWVSVDRLMIIPPREEFKQAAGFVKNQNWVKATEIWQKYSNDRRRRLAITACYNLALVCEIRDKLDLAKDWISKASDLATKYKNVQDLYMVTDYYLILTQRQAEIEKRRNIGE